MFTAMLRQPAFHARRQAPADAKSRVLMLADTYAAVACRFFYVMLRLRLRFHARRLPRLFAARDAACRRYRHDVLISISRRAFFALALSSFQRMSWRLFFFFFFFQFLLHFHWSSHQKALLSPARRPPSPRSRRAVFRFRYARHNV